MKVAIVIWHQIFSILVLVFFFLMLQNRSFFALAPGSGFGASISGTVRVVLLCFASQSLQIAL